MFDNNGASVVARRLVVGTMSTVTVRPIFASPTAAQGHLLSDIFNINKVHNFVDVLPDTLVYLTIASSTGLLDGVIRVVGNASNHNYRRD